MSKGTKRWYATGKGQMMPKRTRASQYAKLRDPSRAYSRAKARKNTAQMLDPDFWI